MPNGKYLYISDFAKATRTTRDTLLHYDKIGLLSPESRFGNKYRCYSVHQIAVVNLIRTLQSLGMTLNEIKDLRDSRTPGLVEDLFAQQIERIGAKIEEWISAHKLLIVLKDIIHSVSNIEEGAITVQFFPAEAIVLGDINDYSRGRDDYDAFVSFYHAMEKKHPKMNLNYPVCSTFSEDRLKRGDWVWPDRFYFKNPEGYDRKPAALYAVGYMRGGYGQTGTLYKRAIDYINKNNFEICGDAYEEYPLNELCITKDNDYLIRLMINVREK